jgi:hypothetical protein
MIEFILGIWNPAQHDLDPRVLKHGVEQAVGFHNLVTVSDLQRRGWAGAVMLWGANTPSRQLTCDVLSQPMF